jgi:hypothetical protein
MISSKGLPGFFISSGKKGKESRISERQRERERERERVQEAVRGSKREIASPIKLTVRE